MYVADAYTALTAAACVVRGNYSFGPPWPKGTETWSHALIFGDDYTATMFIIQTADRKYEDS